jgi:uncharacterized membrane protein YfhO
MNDQPVVRDERTITVENASYRWGYLVVTYGLLILITLRAFFFKQSNWDLMALVILSGLVTTAYQGMHQIFTRRWVVIFALTILVSAVLAALVVFVIR